VADTLGGSFEGRLEGVDNHNPLAKWMVQIWPIWHHHAIYVANCVRYCNDDEDTIWILDFLWSHATIQQLNLKAVSLLGQPGAMFIGQVYKSSEHPWFLPREKIVLIGRVKDVSTWLKQNWDDYIPNLVLIVLPQSVPDADGGRLWASVRCVIC
jgi:hypothetical protein